MYIGMHHLQKLCVGKKTQANPGGCPLWLNRLYESKSCTDTIQCTFNLHCI